MFRVSRNFLCVAFLFAPLIHPTSSASAAEILYGVTGTNLVTIDPTNPANVTVVGPHLLAPGAITGNLTYDPVTDRLIGSVSLNPPSFTRSLYAFDRSTGQATFLSTVSDPSAQFIYEALEYVGGSVNQTIITRAPNSGPQTGISFEIHRVDPNTGATVLVVNNGRDNDFAAWDSRRNRFYATDPNGSVSNNIYEVNLATGSNTDWINVFQSTSQGPGELAYSSDHDAIYAVDFGNSSFYRINLNSAGDPVSISSIGAVGGDRVDSIAFVVPEPSGALLVTILSSLLLHRRRHSVA
jgi:hypothetical protein